jgi:hypothetical protein
MTPCHWIIGSRRFGKKLISSSKTEKSKIRNVPLVYFEISTLQPLKLRPMLSRKVGKHTVTRHHILEDRRLQLRRWENLKTPDLLLITNYTQQWNIRNTCAQKMEYFPVSFIVSKRHCTEWISLCKDSWYIKPSFFTEKFIQIVTVSLAWLLLNQDKTGQRGFIFVFTSFHSWVLFWAR